MAIDTPARHIYSGDGSTRVFPIPTYIQGDDYIRIEINGVHQVDRSKWDIVNNSIIFVTAPITTATIDVQVAASVEALSELGNVTNVDIVAGSIADINDIASKLDEILLSDDNAIIAKEEAWRAEAERLTANSYATEPEDVFVKIYTSNNDGTFTITNTADYSSYHWERKAQRVYCKHCFRGLYRAEAALDEEKRTGALRANQQGHAAEGLYRIQADGRAQHRRIRRLGDASV